MCWVPDSSVDMYTGLSLKIEVKGRNEKVEGGLGPVYKSWSGPSLFLPSHHISNSLITLLTLISGWFFFQRHAFDIWRHGRQDSHIFPVDDHVCGLFRHRVHLRVEVGPSYRRILSPHHFNRWDIDPGKGCVLFWFFIILSWTPIYQGFCC